MTAFPIVAQRQLARSHITENETLDDYPELEPEQATPPGLNNIQVNLI